MGLLFCFFVPTLVLHNHKMNRLILIGNGFDLAHNLKTKYSDFIFGYLMKCFTEGELKGTFEDGLLKVAFFNPQRYIVNNHNLADCKSIQDFQKFVVKQNPVNAADIFGRNHRNYPDPNNRQNCFILTLKDGFFEQLFMNACNYTWVDIEGEYYANLKKLFLSDKKDKLEKVKKLNSSFAHLKTMLHHYISKITLDTGFQDEVFNLLNSSINLRDIPTIHKKELENIRKKEKEYIASGGWEIMPKSTMFLNFNYTDTIAKYAAELNLTSSLMNNIHGTSDVDIVFGYGDEMDETYKQMENEYENEYLKFAKSFGYFRNTSYHDLIRFLDDDIYEIVILGHSCGLSDRTLLNMVFEHDNCKSIKPYYHERKDGSNDFFNKTMEISRHFKNKQKMRERVLPFDKCSPLPQLSE
ncbi:Bacteriophage abortive infection AbiH [Niabella drilacis]|uniref:Bacteriophage abortive infection AbiH n=2 Tax=Niabella drilacis (strain DSM 25811 / CCM 8410 / CCUG 62505 / LMG 26954 / E90) TaxID=1285928 RepID=A0A1G6UJK9_NIADE|nr:Bacteriophage abortive infection AbiH [Niabella drilacis]